MTLTFDLVLTLIALGCFLLAAFNVSSPRINLVAAGLFLWLLTNLV